MLGLSLAAPVLLADLEEMHSRLHQLVVEPEKVAVANAEARHQYVDTEAYVLAGPLYAEQSAAAEAEGSMFVDNPQWMAVEVD
ncbi:hypothetical protein R1sor_011416 [Riccia sorocarpa]|uniref:Uncharacterized protein n=1 Tax=Riccia sorocarpa TaxID=122646 RepID=A0ABD3I4Q1_9MARC